MKKLKENLDGYLPCPFCGNTDILHRWENAVYCGDTVNCCAGMEGGDNHWTKEEMRLNWNRRAKKFL